MERILLSGEEAALKIKAGVDKTAKPVMDSIGPFGTNTLIEKGTRITNDGIRIAQEISLPDEVEDLGSRKLKEAMAKSNDQVGDGSSTIAVLVQAILKEAHKALGTGKSIAGRMSTADFLRKLKSESQEVIEKLKEQTTPITSEEELIRSAVVSVEDEELGALIGKTQWELGESGYIITEEVPEKITTVERVHGVRIDNGFGASHMMNNLEKQMLEVNDCRTILTSHTLQTLQPLKDVLEQLVKAGQRNIVIIARGFAEGAIKDCSANIQNGVNIFPINAPYTDSKEVMKDLAAVLGGQYLDSETHALEDAQLSDVGYAEKVRARRFDAIITGKNTADSEKVQKRISELKQTLEGATSDFEKKNLESRIAQLEHGFAVMKVGAESETERKRVHDKVEDAVNAVRAALQEGTVPGAGLAFKEIAENLPENYILKTPLLAVHTQIMANAPAGFKVEPWVRDPAKVLRVALEQAVSVAGDLATVTSVITTKKDKFNAYVTGS